MDIIPIIEITDGVAKMNAKFLKQVNNIDLKGKFISVTKWSISLKNLNSLLQNSDGHSLIGF